MLHLKEDDDDVRVRADREKDVVVLEPVVSEPTADETESDEQVAASDGGAVTFSDYSSTSTTDDECENCGAQLVDGYAAVFESEDEQKVRACTNCEDKVRERDGTVRLKRQVAARREEGDGT
jgi:DNA-directed RNA polymerase subunit RPC12/RpoP